MKKTDQETNETFNKTRDKRERMWLNLVMNEVERVPVGSRTRVVRTVLKWLESDYREPF